jgi:hypothetical protein
MGGFDERYVAEFPVALVRVEDQIVAFATLWTTASKVSFSMDLMRYSDDAPKNVMDYLFVELLGWGKEQGYQAFEFGVARWPAWRTVRWPRSCRAWAACSTSAARKSTISRACGGTRTSTTRSGSRATLPRLTSGRSLFCSPISACCRPAASPA